MKVSQATVIDVLEKIYIIGRAGRKVGVTSVAKEIGVTVPRARRQIKECVRLGLVARYSNSYRSNVVRSCYFPTQLGMDILDMIAENGSKLI